MAQTAEGELVDRFEQFYRNYYREEIGELAGNYPSEQRSLHVDWTDLYQFDADLADDYISKPEEFREYAEEALRLYDLPVDVSLGQAHVRVHNLPETTDIRAIRSPDVNTLVAVQGIVRKATDVRPKIEEAAFECQRCGTLSYIPQSGGFQEPHECQGCERQGPFSINYDQSTFVDAQKLRVQERPEGLRGGETPQSIDVDLEDDLTGKVAPGDYVTTTGVLRIEQQSSNSEKTRMFDVYMDGHSLVMEDEAFEEMDISEEEKQEIIEISRSEDVYDRMVESIAPSIYGYEEEKLAIAMQLFSGVTKHLPDESRIRGDLHILLIGDPGTGKCQKYSTKVTLPDGSEEQLGDLVEQNLTDPQHIEDGVYQTVDFPVASLGGSGRVEEKRATKIWKREAPDRMYRIRTGRGRQLEVTPSHPLFVQTGDQLQPLEAEHLEEGQFVAAPRELPTKGHDHIDIEYERSDHPNANKLDPPEKITGEFARLLGYIIGEGSVHSSAKSSVQITNSDPEVIRDIADAVRELGLRWREVDHHTHKGSKVVEIGSLEFVSFLERLEPAILDRSAGQRVPDQLMRSSQSVKSEFLKALIEGEGHVSEKEREITVASMSRELLEGVRSLLLALGIQGQLTQRQNGSYRLRISGTDFAKYVNSVGFVTERKSKASKAFGEIPENTNTDVIPGISDELREIREILELSQSDCSVPRTTYQHYERGDRNPSRRSLRAVVDAFEDRVSWLRETRDRIEEGDWNDIESVRRELNISQRALAEEMDVTQTAISYYEREGVAPDGGRAGNAKEVVLDQIDDCLGVSDQVDRLRRLVDGDVAWDRIESIETVDPDYDWVYDLEVEGTHNYLSNGIVSHNSQLLQYIQHIAPRSVYTSGKGSSAAGLTAAAVQSDFGEGQAWTLEAGALVLADKGTAAVDELDKMRCVTGDTLVHCGDGVARIRDLAVDGAETGRIEDLPNGRTIRGVDIDVRTMTGDGRIVTRPVEAIHEYDAPERLQEVTLESGESLAVTPDHPFFVFEDGTRTERAAEDLDSGDWTHVPRRVPDASADGGTAAHARRTTDGSKTTDRDGSVVSPAKGAILGYLAGDGNTYYDRAEGSYGIRFTNAEEELLADFERVCREAFGAEPVRHPSEQREDGVETVRLHGKAHVDELLDAGANLETYEGKRVPEGVTEASREAKAAFIRGLADSEGTVDDRNVTISSSSYDLLLGVKMLLLEFGVSSQIQTRPRDGKRDLYLLVITSKPSIDAFARHVGFTLERKDSALREAQDRVTGTRTILDVVPECGETFERVRGKLRLHQSECGLDSDATYCNFENGDANPSIRLAKRILTRFEDRLDRIADDVDVLATGTSWERLEAIRERYHVSQHDLAADLPVTQPYVSRNWGENPTLRDQVRQRLRDVLKEARSVDLDPLRDIVRGDVKWRRVESVRTVEPDGFDDQRRVLRQRIGDELGAPDPESAESTARDLVETNPSPGTWDELRRRLDQYAIPLRRVAEEMGVDQSTVSRWFSGSVRVGNFGAVRSACSDLIEGKRARLAGLLDRLDARSGANVYDLTVEGTHNFLANGIVVHNSEDRSAMHEALEQQEISISKAGITATLKSRCALLGAANPKYGRFDEYEPIAEQIELDPALVSRFDLIFTVTDQPDEEEDRRLAKHIIQSNYAGELSAQHEKLSSPAANAEDAAEAARDVEPTIEAELLRKYVAFAKRDVFPTMTDAARERIREFYVEMRSQGTGEDAPVPITARKLEALVRLAEASARVRLSDTVEEGDAKRVIEIVQSSLRDVGMDPETGEYDADIVETEMSKSQRDRVKNLKTLIQEIEEEYEEGAPLQEVVDRADELGMDESKADHEIEKLKQKGELYEPQQGYLRTT